MDFKGLKKAATKLKIISEQPPEDSSPYHNNEVLTGFTKSGNRSVRRPHIRQLSKEKEDSGRSIARIDVQKVFQQRITDFIP